MADSKDMNTFDNKSYVNDGNETRVNNRKLSIGEKLERSKTKTVFADLNEEEIKTAKRSIMRKNKMYTRAVIINWIQNAQQQKGP